MVNVMKQQAAGATGQAAPGRTAPQQGFPAMDTTGLVPPGALRKLRSKGPPKGQKAAEKDEDAEVGSGMLSSLPPAGQQP